MPESKTRHSNPSILIVNLARSFGGAELRVIQTARHLQEHQNCAVAVLAESPLCKKLQKEGLAVFTLPYRRSNPRLAFSLAAIIKKHSFNIVDTHNPQSNLWGILGAKLAGRVSVVTTLHNTRDITASYYKTGLYEMTIRINNWAGSNFIAVSESVFQYLLSLSVPKSKISLVKNGLTIPQTSGDNPVRNSMREQFGYSKHHYVIILVGRLEPIKGHHFFISALPEILKKHPTIRCLIVGSGRSEIQLKMLRDKLGLHDIVSFAGFRENVSQLLVASDAYCMPSLSEGLPYALLEAISHKLPVLCTKVGGMATLLENEYSAIMVPPQDSKSLVAGVDTLLKNPKKTVQMANNAYQIVKDSYSMTKMISGTLAVYRRAGRSCISTVRDK